MRLPRLFRLPLLFYLSSFFCLSMLLFPLACAQDQPPPAASGGAGTAPKGQTLTLSEALKLAAQKDVGVAMAQANLSAAQQNLTRTQADPLALKPALLQAKQQVGAAQDALEVARLAAQVSASGSLLRGLGSGRRPAHRQAASPTCRHQAESRPDQDEGRRGY